MIIVPEYDPSITALSPGLRANYESAINTAIQFYETKFTNPITVTIAFGYGEVGGTLVGSGPLAQSSTGYGTYSYNALYAAVQASDTRSSVQRSAAAILPATDPTGGSGSFFVSDAEARALGLAGAGAGLDGSVGLSSTYPFSWSQSSVQPNTYDAVGTLEHEISEVLGRFDMAGAGNKYTLLDMYRYTALDGRANDAPGAVAGVRDLPFVPGFNPNAFSYFSFDGQTVTNPYDTPTHVGMGADIADWSDIVPDDSFGYGVPGRAAVVTSADLAEMNVLGYDIAPCYVRGTRILTERGQVAVEHLRIDDRVRTAAGRMRKIRWIGHRRVAISSHPRPWNVRPFRVQADAFGAGLPERDLLLSPDHALFVDGVLIPVRHLANGASVAQERWQEVHYFHVELGTHDVLLAEGLPAESYLETGNRGQFANSDGPVILHPDFSAGCWEHACARLRQSGPAVVKVRQDLLARLPALGWHKETPALHLAAGGCMIALPAAPDGRYRISLPPHAGTVRLLSGAAPYAAQDPANGDVRPLGVCVGAIAIDGVPVPLVSSACARGFHDIESRGTEAWRWTDGEAVLNLPRRGARVLDLRIKAQMPAWAFNTTARDAACS